MKIGATVAPPRCTSRPVETFQLVEYHFEILAKRIRELSFLNNGVDIEFVRPARRQERNFGFRRHQGFYRVYNKKTPLHKNVLLLQRREERHHGRSAMQWNDSYRRERSVSPTTFRSDGGTH